MLMVPGLFFISLYGLNASLLQCKKKYFLPALAPVAFNAIWIAFALYSRNVETLAWGVTLAFAAQWALTLSPLRGKPHLFSPDFKALLKPLVLGLVGIGAVQFNSALDPFFARLADPQGPAYLWYAIRIQQLPMALFGIALSGALLPPLARAEDPLRRLELLRSALKPAAALMLFCTFGIFCLGVPGVNLLYGHGDFSPAAVEQTVFCLWAYGLGLVPSVFVLLLSARFYAEKNYRLPTQASLFSVLANIFMNALFVFALDLGAISIALATSLSAFLNMALLARGAFDKSFGKFFVKIFFKVAAAALFVFISGKVIFPQLPRDLLSQIIHMLFLTLLYLLCFLNRRTYEYMGLLLSTKSEAGGTSPSR
jgi:putative peptidoglycan lipid II flippase